MNSLKEYTSSKYEQNRLTPTIESMKKSKPIKRFETDVKKDTSDIINQKKLMVCLMINVLNKEVKVVKNSWLNNIIKRFYVIKR